MTRTVVRSNKLMKSLAPSDREQLMMAFQKETYGQGHAVITQGDEGDKFYVLYDGVWYVRCQSSSTRTYGDLPSPPRRAAATPPQPPQLRQSTNCAVPEMSVAAGVSSTQ